jgi:hypothetical protein
MTLALQRERLKWRMKPTDSLIINVAENANVEGRKWCALSWILSMACPSI